MRVGILYNPISGRGGGAIQARKLESALIGSGHLVSLRESRAVNPTEEFAQYLSSIEALVLIGGDGTLRPLLPELARTSVPVYMWPGGNESLFAREFNMTPSVSKLLRALETRKCVRAGYGLVNNAPFFLMTSIGLDSQIVRRVCENRSGPVGRRGYVWPIIKAIASFRGPTLTVTVDGREVLRQVPGYLIIGNSNRYAGNLMPIPEAHWASGHLSCRYFPYKNVMSYCTWIWRYFLGTSIPVLGSQLFQGARFDVEVGDPNYPVQADGDLIGFGSFCVTRAEGTISVLSDL